jgi:hypothetical protein
MTPRPAMDMPRVACRRQLAATTTAALPLARCSAPIVRVPGGSGTSTRRATIVTNNDTQAGIFTVHVSGAYPGGGDRLEGTGTVTLAAEQQGNVAVELHSAHGIDRFGCVLALPWVA